MNKYEAFIFDGTAFDNGEYCDFDSAADIVAGKDIMLGVWNAAGTQLLAISGQQTLTINRSAETIEVNSKSTEGGWKDSLQGMKEWSIETEGLWVASDGAHQALATAFKNGTPVCVKVYNRATSTGMFGGLAIITDYPIEAPYDDTVTFSLTLQGKGALVDFSIDQPTSDVMPS